MTAAKASAAVERVRQLYRDAIAAQGEIGKSIEAKKSELHRLTTSGRRDFTESFNEWSERFETYADEGKRALASQFVPFTRPAHFDPATGNPPPGRGADLFWFRTDDRGKPSVDIGSMLAHLNRDSITAAAREFFEDACADPNVPDQAKREKEIQRLHAEIQELEAEQIAIGDELGELFNKPNILTAKSEAERAERMLAALNEPIERRNAAMPEQRRSPVTISTPETDDGITVE